MRKILTTFIRPITIEVLSSSVEGQISLAQHHDIAEVLPGESHREKATNYLRSLLSALGPEFTPTHQEIKPADKDEDSKGTKIPNRSIRMKVGV